MSASARLRSATTGRLATMVWMSSISLAERSGQSANGRGVMRGERLARRKLADERARLGAEAQLQAIAEGGVDGSVEHQPLLGCQAARGRAVPLIQQLAQPAQEDGLRFSPVRAKVAGRPLLRVLVDVGTIRR